MRTGVLPTDLVGPDREDEASSRIQAPEAKAREVAHTELARRRKYLGSLTTEQEVNIRKLVLSTATEVSSILEQVEASMGQLETRRNSRSIGLTNRTTDELDNRRRE